MRAGGRPLARARNAACVGASPRQRRIHALRVSRPADAAGSIDWLVWRCGRARLRSASALQRGPVPASTERLGGVRSITSIPWGTAHGQPVRLWTLRNGRGMMVRITNYGGVVQSIWVPSRSGAVKNVALGFTSLSDYVNDFEHQPWPAAGGSGDTYFGAIIGRYANRIANGAFTLNGDHLHLPQNNGPNTLHGGPMAYNTKVWTASEKKTASAVSLILTYTDPDGYNGFPGAVTTTVTYTLTRPTTSASTTPRRRPSRPSSTTPTTRTSISPVRGRGTCTDRNCGSTPKNSPRPTPT